MIYFLIGIFLIGIFYYYFFIHRKKVLLKKMISAVDWVKIGVYGRLSLRYKDKYGDEESGLLAAAIINELFSNETSNVKAQHYVEVNKEKIMQELRDLQNDNEMCEMVTEAVRVKVTIAYAKNITDKESTINPLEKLRELGILVPGGKAPSPNTFLHRAYEFMIKQRMN